MKCRSLTRLLDHHGSIGVSWEGAFADIPRVAVWETGGLGRQRLIRHERPCIPDAAWERGTVYDTSAARGRSLQPKDIKTRSFQTKILETFHIKSGSFFGDPFR